MFVRTTRNVRIGHSGPGNALYRQAPLASLPASSGRRAACSLPESRPDPTAATYVLRPHAGRFNQASRRSPRPLSAGAKSSGRSRGGLLHTESRLVRLSWQPPRSPSSSTAAAAGGIAVTANFDAQNPIPRHACIRPWMSSTRSGVADSATCPGGILARPQFATQRLSFAHTPEQK